MFRYIYSSFIFASLFFRIIFSESECEEIQTDYSDNRLNKHNLRLVQFNMEWLFIDYYKNADCPGNGCTWKNESEMNIHIDHVTNVINDLQPDIMNIYVAEGCDEIKQLYHK